MNNQIRRVADLFVLGQFSSTGYFPVLVCKDEGLKSLITLTSEIIMQ